MLAKPQHAEGTFAVVPSDGANQANGLPDADELKPAPVAEVKPVPSTLWLRCKNGGSGKYHLVGKENHGHHVWSARAGGCHLYFWDERDGAEWKGWWVAEEIGAPVFRAFLPDTEGHDSPDRVTGAWQSNLGEIDSTAKLEVWTDLEYDMAPEVPKGGIATEVAQAIKVGDDSWIKAAQGWVDFQIVDTMIRQLLPMRNVSLATGPKLSPVDAVLQMKDNLAPLVRSTPNSPGQCASWALGLVSLIFGSASVASNLLMLAVKGGPACDAEIDFIEMVMPRLGFTVIETRSSIPVDAATSYFWEWSLERAPPAARYTVRLQQFLTVEKVTALDQTFASWDSTSQVPDLKRVGIVSSPVAHKDGTLISEIFTSTIIDGLDIAARRAKDKGFAPHARESDEERLVYWEYFDL